MATDPELLKLLAHGLEEFGKLYEQGAESRKSINIIIISMAVSLNGLLKAEEKRDPEFTKELRSSFDAYLGKLIGDKDPEILTRVRNQLRENLDEIDQEILN